jgi:hypothetical protein
MFLLVVVLSVHVSFGSVIACPCFFWSTWTDNTTSIRNMDTQYNDQKKHGQTIQRPKETWTSVHVSFGSCIVCPCFLWSLYCLSMFLLVVVLSVHVSFGSCIDGLAIQRPKETWTGNITTKRNMDRQYNNQKKHGVSFGRCIVCPCLFWSLYCLSMFPLVVVLPETWTGNTTTKRNMDRQYNDQKKHGQAN